MRCAYPDDPGFAERFGEAMLRRGVPIEYGPAALDALRDLRAEDAGFAAADRDEEGPRWKVRDD